MEIQPWGLFFVGAALLLGAVGINLYTRYQIFQGKSSEAIHALLSKDYFVERLLQRWLRYDWVLALAGFLWVTLAAVWTWTT